MAGRKAVSSAMGSCLTGDEGCFPLTTKLDERKHQLIKGLVQARTKVLQAVWAVPPSRADEIFLGIWSLQDLLAHLEGWDYTNLQAVQEILAGKPPTFFQYADKDWRSYNQRLVEQYKRPSLEQLLAELDASHRQLIAYLESLPARDVANGKVKRETGRSVTIRNLLQAEARDETKHAEQVRIYFGLTESSEGA